MLRKKRLTKLWTCAGFKLLAGSNACNPIIFEPMVMSVLLGQQKMIRTLQRKIDALLVATLQIEKTKA